MEQEARAQRLRSGLLSLLMIALFAFVVGCVLLWLYSLSWIFYPDLEPGFMRQFDAWYVKETAGVGLRDLAVLMFLVLGWGMLSIRDTLREIRAELKLIRTDLKRLGDSN